MTFYKKDGIAVNARCPFRKADCAHASQIRMLCSKRFYAGRQPSDYSECFKKKLKEPKK